MVAITAKERAAAPAAPRAPTRPPPPDWTLRTPLEHGTSLLYLEYRAADLAFVREGATGPEAAGEAIAALARAAARYDLRTVLGLEPPERDYFPHLQGLAERGLLEPGDEGAIVERIEEDFALRRAHRRAAKPAGASARTTPWPDTPVQDDEMRALAERHQLRWIAERHRGARGPGDGGRWASAIEAELEALAEVMGAAPRTLGLGRRFALVLGAREQGEEILAWNGATAVARIEPGAEGGSDLARAWGEALLETLEAQAGADDIEVIEAFEEALERECPEGEDPDIWREHTFEAFVEAEGWACAGGDVAQTTRDGAAPEARGAAALRYPRPGETRARTNWVWRTLRAAIEWDEDRCALVTTADAFERAQHHRAAYIERMERAKTELARVSARSAANARAAGLGLTAVATLDAGGASAWLVRTDAETLSGAGDDGRVPDLSERWVLAQIAEGVAAQARHVLGRNMGTGWVRAERRASGRWASRAHGWTPAQGVDGAGDPTYGGRATIRIERWGASVTLMAGNAGETLASLGETIAEAACAQAASEATAMTLEWDIECNTWTTTLEEAPVGASATEIMSGERTGAARAQGAQRASGLPRAERARGVAEGAGETPRSGRTGKAGVGRPPAEGRGEEAMSEGDGARRARAAQAMLASEDEWRWNAGYKAITSVWAETVEDAERAYAQSIAEHVDGVGEGGEVTAEIVAALRQAAPETMAEIEDVVDAGSTEDARERAREILTRALAKSAAMRECYLAVTHAMFDEALQAKAA